MTITALIQGHLRRVSRKRQSRLAIHRRRHYDDDGMTLTELLIASTLLVVLLTVVMLTMNVVDSVTTSVGAQYQEFDQALPALAPLQQLLRAEVEPAPTSYPPPTALLRTTPTPPFASIGNYSLTFYANIGMADGNVATEQTCTPPPPFVRPPPLLHPSRPVQPRSWPHCSSPMGLWSRPTTNARHVTRAASRFGSGYRSSATTAVFRPAPSWGTRPPMSASIRRPTTN